MREADWLSPAAMAKRIRFAMGIAAGRVPLAQGASDNGRKNFNLKDMDSEKPRFMEGTACDMNPALIDTTMGPVSDATRASLQDLKPKEHIAALLASPEAMKR